MKEEVRVRKKLCKRALRECPSPIAWQQPPNLPSLHDKYPQKTKKSDALIAMRYPLAHRAYHYAFHILLTNRHDVGGVGGGCQ